MKSVLIALGFGIARSASAQLSPAEAAILLNALQRNNAASSEVTVYQGTGPAYPRWTAPLPYQPGRDNWADVEAVNRQIEMNNLREGINYNLEMMRRDSDSMGRRK